MKRFISLIIISGSFILGAILLTSCKVTKCDGLQDVDEIYIDSIYSSKTIKLTLEDVEWDQGLRAVGGAWYKTKKSSNDAFNELLQAGMTQLDISYSDYKFVQINNRGMYSVLITQFEKYTAVQIYEMSYEFFPFPLYAIDESEKTRLSNLYLNNAADFSEEMTNFIRIKKLINDFQNRLNIYYKVEEDENSMRLYYGLKTMNITYIDNILNFELEEIA